MGMKVAARPAAIHRLVMFQYPKVGSMGMKVPIVSRSRTITIRFQYPKVGSMGMKERDSHARPLPLAAVFQYPKVGSMGMKALLGGSHAGGVQAVSVP